MGRGACRSAAVVPPGGRCQTAALLQELTQGAVLGMWPALCVGARPQAPTHPCATISAAAAAAVAPSTSRLPMRSTAPAAAASLASRAVLLALKIILIALVVLEGAAAALEARCCPLPVILRAASILPLGCRLAGGSCGFQKIQCQEI